MARPAWRIRRQRSSAGGGSAGSRAGAVAVNAMASSAAASSGTNVLLMQIWQRSFSGLPQTIAPPLQPYDRTRRSVAREDGAWDLPTPRAWERRGTTQGVAAPSRDRAQHDRFPSSQNAATSARRKVPAGGQTDSQNARARRHAGCSVEETLSGCAVEEARRERRMAPITVRGKCCSAGDEDRYARNQDSPSRRRNKRGAPHPTHRS